MVIFIQQFALIVEQVDIPLFSLLSIVYNLISSHMFETNIYLIAVKISRCVLQNSTSLTQRNEIHLTFRIRTRLYFIHHQVD